MVNISRRDFLKGSVAAGAVAATQPWSFVFPKNVQAAASNAPESYGYTFCDMCNTVPKCGIKATIKDNLIIKVEAREKYPNSPICAKGIATLQELYDPNRLLYPMKRTTPKGSADPGWQKISWDEALKTIADNLTKIKKDYGAEKVMFYAGDPKEARAPLRRLAYNFGSPNYGCESSTCAKSPQATALMTYGTATTGSDPSAKTKVCLIWSTNPAHSGPYRFHGLLEAKASGVKFIVVDPRVTPTVDCLADIHLQLRPGTDGALALGFAHVIIRDGLHDKEFVEKWAHGFDKYAEYVKEFTPEKVAEITQVPAALIEEAAKLWATDRPGTWLGSACGTSHSSNAHQNHRAIISLVGLVGNFDIDGGVSIPTYPINYIGDENASAEWAGTTTLLPKLIDKRVDKKYVPVWAEVESSIQANWLVEYVETGEIRGMVMVGGNAMMWPQSQEYQKAIEKMDFGVALDYYLRPWTHNFMDVVLPAAMPYERMNAMAVFGRSIYLKEPLVKPQGEARPDWRILCDIGTALGYSKEFFGGGENSEEAALKDVLKTLNVVVTLDQLRATPEKMVTIPAPGPNEFKKYESGKLRKDGKPGFQTPSGKMEFVSTICEKHGFDGLPVYKEPLESPVSTPDLAKEYPLILNTGSRLPFYTHSKLREFPWLNQFMPNPVVFLNSKDAQARGIKDGDDVKIISKHGSVKVKAAITNIQKPGVIDVFHGWHQANINLVVPRHFDPILGFPAFKEGLCEVKKV